MKQILALLSFFAFFCLGFSQNLTAKLVAKSNGKPIPYANIKTGKYSGVISNDEGYFTIHAQTDDSKTIEITCMGFESKTLSISEIKKLNFTIALKDAVNQLNEVLITNKRPNADAIIEKVRSKISENYDNELNAYSIFHRNTDRVDFRNLGFEIEKASHVKKKNINDANASLEKMASEIIASDMVHFKDFKGEFFNLNPDSSKIKVSKATKLLDSKNNFSIDDVQKKTQNIVLKYLDTTITYKLKSGLFKIEDTLSLTDEQFKDFEKQVYNMPYLNNESRNLLRKAQFFEESFLSNIINPKLYDYAYDGSALKDGKLFYLIDFEPRRGKSKYGGKLYISEADYAITRVDYGYYKNRHGQKVNLKLVLGVKFIANVDEGTLLFEKNQNGKYHPKYLKQTTGAYFYVNRDLKFIENSRARNKTNINFKIEGQNLNKEELLFTANEKLTLEGFKLIKQDDTVPYTLLSSFEETIWGDGDILEPTLEMKTFDASED
ncbi:carboxypeptidase-like regulatory domain-containing protein [Hyunsoonleella sp. SJ7]|uniref:Carboxypeptidase-like regulatory domain-containing protein n=1 Tax=Hyunsoonleella aquatilis TaxID=2762758 RepID=A0A923HF16_9FLAO|nr:carboxypeptidase-like regulatory domain-containing protein [Hyunsoonleella aquatilis]MBC3759986.1 carboxypeptidase-like regulatory domain-containing protein [Hyunsoonleella aquatilis]